MMKRPDDPRLGDLLEAGLHGTVVFVLYPCDVGVARNGGRVGARHGPEKFLEFLHCMGTVYNPEYGIDLSQLKLSYYKVPLDDCLAETTGSSTGRDPLQEAHHRLTEAVRTVLDNGGFPFVVGGGNDQSFANWRALRQWTCQQDHDNNDSSPLIGVVNIDAHLDVRPSKLPTSGTPFRQILEQDASSTRLWEFAAQGSQCSREHAEYVKSHGGSILWLKDVQHNAVTKFQEEILDQQRLQGIPYAFVSFDLDAIQASDCPGVSCPATIGLTAQDALGIMRAAGRAGHVHLVDISELNPAVEDAYISPRLAVLMAYHFLLGFCQRVENKRPKTNIRPAPTQSLVSVRAYRLRISHLSQLVCVEDVQKQGFRTGEQMGKLRVIEDGTILVGRDGRISYVGPTTDAPNLDPCEIDHDIDGRGKSAIPGLCDGHTHPVWAGDRVHEFAMKLAGATYMDIHKIGGGIHYTVKHTRKADQDSLYKSLIARLDRMNETGTTLVECKSGYGLDTATELKMLRVIDRAQRNLPFMDIVGNFCGAHSIPQGATEEQAVDTVVNEMIPALAKEQKEGNLASIKLIDVFTEKGVFSPQSTERILEAGAQIGLLSNFHGDELTYQGCGELAGKLNCRAVSHLEHVSDEGIAAMKKSHTAAVLLPTTAFVLRITPPPARKLIDSGIPVALGSDFNPNAYCSSMTHVMHLACITMQMTVEEALVASTLNAAYSMGMQDAHGSLEVGKCGDIVLVDEPRWEHVVYQFGGDPPLCAVIKDGVPRHIHDE